MRKIKWTFCFEHRNYETELLTEEQSLALYEKIQENPKAILYIPVNNGDVRINLERVVCTVRQFIEEQEAPVEVVA